MAEHRGSTDKVNRVSLPSAILSARWGVLSAPAGQPAPLEVMTLFVGDGSAVDIEVRGASGKTLGRTSATVGQNCCSVGFVIPEKTAEDVYFEAKLPKHGLNARSSLLKVLPPRKITNARWDRKEARRGDLVKLMADTEGIPDGAEVQISIYEHDADGAHDLITELAAVVKGKKVESQWEYDYHEDTDEIPTKEECEKGYRPPEYFFTVRSGPVKADSGLLEFKDWLEVALADEESSPIGDAEYVIHLPDASERRGRTDESGLAREESIPPGPCRLSFTDGGQLEEVRQNGTLRSLGAEGRLDAPSGNPYFVRAVPFIFSA